METTTISEIVETKQFSKALLFLEYHLFLNKNKHLLDQRLSDALENVENIRKILFVMHRVNIYQIHLHHNAVFYNHFKALERLLNNINNNKQARNKKKDIFNNKWNINLGRLINAYGATGFTIKHNIYKGKGVSECKIPKKWKIVWNLCKHILLLIDEEYADGDYFAVAINRMDKQNHFVKSHIDKFDLCHQYCLTVGNFEGGETEIEINNTSIIRNYWYRILKMDGRLPHRVLPFKNYKLHHVRFAIIWYKLYDPKIVKKRPILKTAEFVV